MEKNIPPRRPIPPRPPQKPVIKRENEENVQLSEEQKSKTNENNIIKDNAEQVTNENIDDNNDSLDTLNDGKVENAIVESEKIGNSEQDKKLKESNKKEKPKQNVQPIIKIIDPVKRDRNRRIWLSIFSSLCLIGAIVCFVMLAI